ncbi:MAG: DUF1993 domain-containing protein [Pseudomonadota bacterium]
MQMQYTAQPNLATGVSVMDLSFYDLSITSYLQTLDAVSSILEKGAESLKAPNEMVNHRLAHDMLPLSFQIRSVAHHSLGAIRGIEAGQFGPPPSVPDMDYAGLQAHVSEAAQALRDYEPDAVNALADKTLEFKAGSLELPFTAVNFIESFSKPNFYFHATTTYTLLRIAGVHIGKLDFIGTPRVG